MISCSHLRSDLNFFCDLKEKIEKNKIKSEDVKVLNYLLNKGISKTYADMKGIYPVSSRIQWNVLPAYNLLNWPILSILEGKTNILADQVMDELGRGIKEFKDSLSMENIRGEHLLKRSGIFLSLSEQITRLDLLISMIACKVEILDPEIEKKVMQTPTSDFEFLGEMRNFRKWSSESTSSGEEREVENLLEDPVFESSSQERPLLEGLKTVENFSKEAFSLEQIATFESSVLETPLEQSSVAEDSVLEEAKFATLERSSFEEELRSASLESKVHENHFSFSSLEEKNKLSLANQESVQVIRVVQEESDDENYDYVFINEEDLY